MANEDKKLLDGRDWKERLQTKADSFEFRADYLERGFCPTGSPEGCVVEPEGICPHDFKSIALEYGLN